MQAVSTADVSLGFGNVDKLNKSLKQSVNIINDESILTKKKTHFFVFNVPFIRIQRIVLFLLFEYLTTDYVTIDLLKQSDIEEDANLYVSS